MGLTFRVGIMQGRHCPNLPSDQEQIMELLNRIPYDKGGARMPEGPATFRAPRPGFCDSFLHECIKNFQRKCGIVPDGYIDPGGFTWNRLVAATGAGSGNSGNSGGTGKVSPTPVPTPTPTNTPIPVSRPANMRESAWRYVLNFTRRHESLVPHMYNNRRNDKQAQDVTCGIGFLLSPRSAAVQGWVKAMFFDPSTKLTPSDAQLLADWDAAAGLFRTDQNLSEYANVWALCPKV